MTFFPSCSFLNKCHFWKKKKKEFYICCTRPLTFVLCSCSDFAFFTDPIISFITVIKGSPEDTHNIIYIAVSSGRVSLLSVWNEGESLKHVCVTQTPARFTPHFKNNSHLCEYMFGSLTWRGKIIMHIKN